MLRKEFWKTYSLEELNKDEWEALCDGCALCCMHRLQDEDSGHIAQTDVACRYLNFESCSCSDYENRHINVPDCVPFDVEKAKAFFWLPETCAYRLKAQDQALPQWHYLESGDKNLVHELFLSAKEQAVPENMFANEEEWQERIVRWVS